MSIAIDPAASAHPREPVLARLREDAPILFALVAGTAGFAAYFAMYAFRKPIAAAQFAIPGWDFAIDYKTCLIIAQVLGYALSKVVGIRVIAEFGRRGRGFAIIGLVATAWLALVVFALVPPPWNIAFLFVNGVPLGMIWGLVFSYMEGRRISELLGAMMCASFIVASGVVKSVATALMGLGVSEFWMPAATGALFFVPLVLAVGVLERLPPPDVLDEQMRTARTAMPKTERAGFFARHGLLLAVLVLAYTLVTALRDFRDSFAAEIWVGLGYARNPAVFSQSELPIGIFVLAALAALVAIKDNRVALLAMHGLIILGGLLLAAATWGFQAGWIGPLWWMILTGTGLYLVFTPFNAMLFDRLIALFGRPGNAGFLIYVADAAGYVGSVGLLLYRSIATPNLAWVTFYARACYVTAAIVIPLAIVAATMLKPAPAQGQHHG